VRSGGEASNEGVEEEAENCSARRGQRLGARMKSTACLSKKKLAFMTGSVAAATICPNGQLVWKWEVG
jgi:hypothetical protein